MRTFFVLALALAVANAEWTWGPQTITDWTGHLVTTIEESYEFLYEQTYEAGNAGDMDEDVAAYFGLDDTYHYEMSGIHVEMWMSVTLAVNFMDYWWYTGTATFTVFSIDPYQQWMWW
jgi:hypothetical protein